MSILWRHCVSSRAILGITCASFKLIGINWNKTRKCTNTINTEPRKQPQINKIYIFSHFIISIQLEGDDECAEKASTYIGIGRSGYSTSCIDLSSWCCLRSVFGGQVNWVSVTMERFFKILDRYCRRYFYWESFQRWIYPFFSFEHRQLDVKNTKQGSSQITTTQRVNFDSISPENGAYNLLLSDYVSKSIFDFAHDIGLSLLQSRPDNKFEIFSPVSIVAALNLVLLGAKGSTFDELLSALKYGGSEYLQIKFPLRSYDNTFLKIVSPSFRYRTLSTTFQDTRRI